jgi:hypothetical protein
MADLAIDPAALLSEEGAVKLAELFTMSSGAVALSHAKAPDYEFGCHVMLGAGTIERSTMTKAPTLDQAVRASAAAVLTATARTEPPPAGDSDPVASDAPSDDEGEWR